MKLNAKDVLKPALLLFVICLCVTALLAGVNSMTKDMIAQNAKAKEEASRRMVLPTATEFVEEETCTVGYADGEVVGYVYVTSGKGYGGDVQVMTGISADGEICGVVVLKHGETPGLGANCERESFREQYLQAVPAGDFEVIKSSNPVEGQIEAMTGATISSRAVSSAVSEACALFRARG